MLKVLLLVALVLFQSQEAFALAATPTVPFILSVTQSGDFSDQNSILQFDPHNVTNIFGIQGFPYHENIIGRAYDPKNHRVFFYSESFEIIVYDALTMNLTRVLPLTFSSTFATAFHYDPSADRLWFGTPLENGFEFSYLAVNETNGTPQVAATVSGSWMADLDASAFDYTSRLLAAQVSDMNGGNYVVTINVDTMATSQPAAMSDLCQDMHAVDVNGTTKFVCATFTLNLLVVVDPMTGAFTEIAALPWFENPNLTATAVLRLPEDNTSRYFAQLYGAWVYTFVEYDIRTGLMLHNSSIPVGQLPELAYCTYVRPRATSLIV